MFKANNFPPTIVKNTIHMKYYIRDVKLAIKRYEHYHTASTSYELAKS